jgi:hypothetical protein
VKIEESDLQLVVSEKTLGRLTTNAKQILEIVKAGLSRYDIKNYDESNISLAKTDKALLNKAEKELNAKRLEIEREFMQPFGEFKAIVTETVGLINKCSAKIDKVVKQSEDRAKELKKELIIDYFATTGFTLVPFDKIFDAKWLNKTTSMKGIYQEIDNKTEKIKSDIETLESFGEDAGLLKSLYLDTLDISKTLQYANTLKQNRERLEEATEKAAKAKAEEKANMAPRLPQTQPQQKPAGTIPYWDPPEEPARKQQEEVGILVRAFRVKTTREKIIALGDFMNDNDIDFEKIEL